MGHVAIQLAKWRGAQVCTTVSTPEKANFVQSLGADLPILYPQVDFAPATLDWTQGTGVDVAFDTVGGDLLARTFPAVKVYGDLVTILAPAPETSWKVARDRNLRISLELMLTPMLKSLETARLHQARLHQARLHQAKLLADCSRLFDQGALKIHLHKTFPLAEAAQAHQFLEQGAGLGKIALVIDP